MRRISPRRLGVLAIAALTTVTALTALSGSAQAVEGTGTISGTLTTAGGAPVAGAKAEVTNGPYSAQTTTAANGTYAIADIPTGDQYRVRFLPVAGTHPGQYAHDQTNYQTAALFAVQAGQTTTVDESLLPTGIISGKLTKSDGNPLASTSVTAYSGQGYAAFANTAADGTYQMVAFPGAYQVYFQTPAGTQYAFGKLGSLEADVINVQAGQTVIVNDTMLPLGSMSGQVTTAVGGPAAGIVVRIDGSGVSKQTTTDANGNYTFSTFAGSGYRVSLRTPSGAHMYAPHSKQASQAQLYTITPGQDLHLDVTLLPAGTLSGTFISGGTGLAGIGVYSYDLETGDYVSATTGADGTYSIPGVFTGSYKIQFLGSGQNVAQWAHGKVSAENADVFAVNANANTVVDETKLATGTVRLRAKNKLTGQAIQSFGASIGAISDSTSDGLIEMVNVPIGTYRASLYWSDGDGTADNEGASITVGSGQTADFEFIVRPAAKLTVKVVDAATNEPQVNACVVAWTEPFFRTFDGCSGWTDHDGNATMSWRMHTGDYALFVIPSDRQHGIQWVGSAGGTGDQKAATRFHIQDGQTTTGPVVRLDPAGSISGKVTSETGKRFYGGVGVITGWDSPGSIGAAYAPVAADGSYTVTGLGPYQWPLLFSGGGHAMQWSGGTSSRFDATKIQVIAGATATYNHLMKTGTTITGTVANGPAVPPGWARITASEASTGDIAGLTDSQDGAYQLRVLPGASIKINLDYTMSGAYWQLWLEGTGFPNSKTLKVRGKTTLDMCVTSGTTLVDCTRPVVPGDQGPEPVPGSGPPPAVIDPPYVPHRPV